MKPGWTRQPIAALARHNLGKMLDRAKNRGEMRPYLRNLNVRWFDFDLTDVLQMRFESDEADRYTLRKGDLVICEGGYPGRGAVWSDEPIYFQKALHRVRFHEPAYARWCLYYLLFQDLTDRLSAHFNGAGIQHFTGEALAKFEIPVPPVNDVTHIVAILDEAFEGIATAKAHAEKSLQNAREVFDTYLATTFAGAGVGWSVGPVGAVADCCLGKMLDKAKNKGDAKPYLRNLNVRWFEFDLTDVQEMRFTPEEYERYSVRRGDVVICEGGYPGRGAVWEEDRPIFIQKALHRVRFKDALFGRWFLYYLYSQEASGALQQYFTGTGIQHFTGAALSRLPFPLAPSAVTATLVERFDALAGSVSNLEAIYRSKVTALEELKKSLLHQAFSGQL